jgi:hypothetical protein
VQLVPVCSISLLKIINLFGPIVMGGMDQIAPKKFNKQKLEPMTIVSEKN